MDKKLNCMLLVDDDTITNTYNQIVINRLEVTHHIEIATDGKQALDYLTRQGSYANAEEEMPFPEIIFLDINMPGMNGFEFLEAIEKLEVPNIPKIVMLTTSFLDEDREKAESFDFVKGYLSKPLEKKDFFAAIDDLV